MIQAAFQVGKDFAVNSQGHIVPADIAAVFRAVVQLHIDEGIWFQPLLCGYGIVICLSLTERGKGGFLGYPHNFRVIPHQRIVYSLILDPECFGFWSEFITNKYRHAFVEADGNVAGAAPFAGAGRSLDFAGCTAEGLRDNV